MAAVISSTRPFRLEGFAAMVAVGCQIAVVFALSTLPTPLYGDYRNIFGYGDIAASLVYGAYVVGTITSLLFLGRLSDQIGRKKAALPSLALAALAGILFLPADHSLPLLYLARAVTGLAVGMSTGAAVAWMPELDPQQDKHRAALTSVAFNIFGLGLGPLVAGVLADAAPAPLHLSYVVYLLALIPLVFAIYLSPETVEDRKPLREVSFKPKIGVESDKLVAFLSPAISNFVLFSLVGFYSAITPSMLAKTLHRPSHILCGLVVGALFLVGVATALAAAKMKPKAAMLSGAFMLLPTCGLLATAQAAVSFPPLLAGTAAGGIALGLGYRGSMEVANGLAGEDKRAALMAAYLLAGNLGTVLPVIGVGIVTQVVGAGTAVPAFSAFVAVLSLAALGFGAFSKTDAN
jgi:MFS family permease